MSSTRLRVAGLLIAGALLNVPALAYACQVPKPTPPMARCEHSGEKPCHCVEDLASIRRNHMSLILHKRNLTMRQGIRTSENSLKECIACHADQRPDGSYIPVNDPGQFCQSCHAYVGAQPDCFECHATTPAAPPATKH
ncbi:Sulfite reduction-associated complex DsrMKJOP multiheme protein DsrJ (HmeF) [Gammaproteobacteria bacterium]